MDTKLYIIISVFLPECNIWILNLSLTSGTMEKFPHAFCAFRQHMDMHFVCFGYELENLPNVWLISKWLSTFTSNSSLWSLIQQGKSNCNRGKVPVWKYLRHRKCSRKWPDGSNGHANCVNLKLRNMKEAWSHLKFKQIYPLSNFTRFKIY